MQGSGVTIMCVVGARPNFMKIAPVINALRSHSKQFTPYLVHTGQHYDEEMKHCFFDQLGIPEPDVDLGVGSASHAVQTAEIMRRFEPVVDAQKPSAVLVVGDVNSTIACALVAVKKGVPVIHVEAGLRSNDRTMPEEINRILTDQISDLLFITERSARDNLIAEGISEDRIHFVGNVMIDSLLGNLSKAKPVADVIGDRAEADIFMNNQGYGILTLHRPSNVDDKFILMRLVQIIRELSEELPLIFPVHPRTLARIKAAGVEAALDTPRILQLPPLGYLEMLGLMSKARLVLTDSGGMQEETTALGVPCITLRENTERPITVEQGTNTIVGTDPERIREIFNKIMENGGKAGCVPEYWDGKASERIAEIIGEKIN